MTYAGLESSLFSRAPTTELGSKFSTWLYQHLRWMMHIPLLLLAALTSISGAALWHEENSRGADVELVAVVGAQRLLSQRVALLAAPKKSVGDKSLDMTLIEAKTGAIRIEKLLGVDSPQHLSELPIGLAIALLRSKAARERLWDAAQDFLGSRLGYDAMSEPARYAILCALANASLEASQDLLIQVQRYSRAKSHATARRAVLIGEASVVLMLLIALLGVEPVARFARRQRDREQEFTLLVNRLTLVATHARDAIIIMDENRQIVWVNDAFPGLSGYSFKEAIGRKVWEFLQNGETDATDVDRLRTALDGGKSAQGRLLTRKQNGCLYWLDIDVHPIFDLSTITGFIAFGRAATADVAKDERLQTILTTLPTGVVEQDRHGVIVRANDAAQEVLGLTYEEVLGRLSVDDRWRTVREDMSAYPGTDHAITRSLRDGISIRGDRMGLVTAQGNQKWLSINSSPLRDETGEICGAVACFSDATESRSQQTCFKWP